jgi:predicted transcriptional regulator of viral defense system
MTQLRRLSLLLEDGTLWRSAALAAEGIDRQTIARAMRAGIIARVSRGTYRIAKPAREDDVSLAAALKRAPRAVVCLLSAAHHHGLISEEPPELWLAVPAGGSLPRIEHVPTRILSWRHRGAFDVGISKSTKFGVTVAMTNPARTVLDLLRYQRRIEGGAKIALSAARRLIEVNGSPDDLSSMAAKLACTADVLAAVDVIAGLAPGSTEHKETHRAVRSPTKGPGAQGRARR